MIALATIDDWTTVDLQFDNGVDPALSFVPTSAVSSLVELLVELQAWLLAQFADATTFDVAAGSDGGIVATLLCSSSYTLTANAAAQSLLGFGGSTGPAATLAATSSAAGTLGSQAVELQRYWRDAGFEGDASASGSTCSSSAGTAARRPALALVLQAAQAHRWATLQSRIATPRASWLWRSSSWSSVVLGASTRERVGLVWWRLRFEVRA